MANGDGATQDTPSGAKAADGAGVSSSAAALGRMIVALGPITRKRLADRLRLSPASLTRLTRPLFDAGVLREIDVDTTGNGAGRPTRPLDIVPGVGTIYGIKLTASAMHLAVTDLKANLAVHETRPLAGHTPASVAAMAAELVARHPPAPGQPTALGICLGGTVLDGRQVAQVPDLGWKDVPLATLIEDAAGIPVTVENDVVGLTHGLHWFGPGRDLTDFAVITIGHGVGYGLVRQDRVVSPLDAGLGLASHIPLGVDGPVCARGHAGCAGGLLTIPRLTAQAADDLGRPVGYDELLAAGAAGQPPAAARLVDSAACGLGRLIALAANLTMQPAVILSGEGIGLWDVAQDKVRAAAAGDRDPDAAPLRIEVDFASSISWVRGAAALAISSVIARI
ncbi:MAG: ROK family protein [Bifidobacteriaceae bacterium]|jgi:predicted NBD/HSP70 family sugar kinase|nr:ROK family protein [Bifidobacteriaceae bacterium]